MLLATLRESIAYIIYPEGRHERRALHRQTQVDPFTGLGNREALKKALVEAEADEYTAVVLFDMNNLGAVNKRVGHKAGDRYIRRAARTLELFAKHHTGAVRAFRYGGDEFVVLAHIDEADEFRRAVSMGFGVHEVDGIYVSLSGACGETLADADSRIQQVKRKAKAEHSYIPH